jgi:hypothetical protein
MNCKIIDRNINNRIICSKTICANISKIYFHLGIKAISMTKRLLNYWKIVVTISILMNKRLMILNFVLVIALWIVYSHMIWSNSHI